MCEEREREGWGNRGGEQVAVTQFGTNSQIGIPGESPSFFRPHNWRCQHGHFTQNYTDRLSPTRGMILSKTGQKAHKYPGTKTNTN